MEESEFIYEVDDSTDDEVYYAISVHRTLEDAIDSVTKGEGEEGWSPPRGDGAWDDDEHAAVEIRERKFGAYGRGRRVWERSWHKDFTEEMDEYPWIVDEIHLPQKP